MDRGWEFHWKRISQKPVQGKLDIFNAKFYDATLFAAFEYCISKAYAY